MSRTSQRVILTLLMIAHPVLAFASADEHHGMSTPLKLGVMTINLLIFLAILRSSALPAVKEWVADRRSQVVDALEKAANAKREAEQLKQQWTERLASLDKEIVEMRAQAQTQIESERDQILEAAAKLADSIRRDAERAAEQELRNARDLLRSEVAQRAYQMAVAAAPSAIGSGEQQRFVDEFLDQVAK